MEVVNCSGALKTPSGKECVEENNSCEDSKMEPSQKRAVVMPTCMVEQSASGNTSTVVTEEDGNAIESTTSRRMTLCDRCQDLSITDGHIMISYNKKARAYADDLKCKLVKKGYKVWIDYNNIMKGESVLEAMSEAVEKANIFLMLYSSDYKASANCRAEAEYAFEKKRVIIPVQVEQGYIANGWLGMVIGAKYRYNLVNPLKKDKELAALLNTVDSISSPASTTS